MEDLASTWKAKVEPMKGAQWPIAYRRGFSRAEIDVLRHGLWPRDMDERWIIWLEGGVLRLWRSWSQTCVYELPIAVLDDGIGEARLALVLDEAAYYLRCPTEEASFTAWLGCCR